jgi:hypothetical protein
MRLLAAALAALVSSGCTLVFNGDDLRGTALMPPVDGGCTLNADAAPPSFAMPVAYPAGQGLNGIIRADLDGDGLEDIATSNIDGDDVTILWGTGATTFSLPQHLSSSPGPTSIAAGDLNGDGKIDLVVTGSNDHLTPPSYKLSVLLNQGARTFASHADYVTLAQPYAVALGDVDGDGHLDAIVAEDSADRVSVFTGTGDGRLMLQADYAACPTCATTPNSVGPYYVTVADLDGDGKLDILSVDESSWDVGLLFNDGTGHFPPAKVKNYLTGSTPHHASVGDVNGDGKPDIVVASALGNQVNVFLNQGGGVFASPANYDVGTITVMGMSQIKDPEGVYIADVNLDGHPDLVTLLFGSASMGVFLGRAGGSFDSKMLEFPATSDTMAGPAGAVVADVNGDCRPDVLVANHKAGGGSVTLLLNQGM